MDASINQAVTSGAQVSTPGVGAASQDMTSGPSFNETMQNVRSSDRMTGVHVEQIDEVQISKDLETLHTNVANVEDDSVRSLLTQRISSIEDRFADLTNILDQFGNGHKASPEELLTLQIRAHRVTQSIEVLSKTVEQSVSGLKTVFQTNV